MLLGAIVVALSIGSVQDLSSAELQRYYWDCDTLFMRGELGGQDFHSCLAITEEFKERVFKNDRELFMQYWRRQNLTEWYKRGFTPRVEDLPRYRHPQ
jgi:hypothetical protein